MINEKYYSHICIIAMILAMVFMVSLLVIKGEDKLKATFNDNGYEIENVVNKDKVLKISIDMKEADWKWLLENATKEEYRSANVTIDGEIFYNVGIRPKGNSSLTSVAKDDDTDRFSFKLDFDQYVNGQTYHGIEKLALNNMMSDATYMKEYISYDIYDFLGVPVPEYGYTNISVNGSEWGLYLAVEVIDERFIEKNYGTSQGNLYKPDNMNMVGKEKDGIKEQPKGNEKIDMKDIPKDRKANENEEIPMMGGKTSGGTNLKYVDDNIESYSIVRDSAVFKTTTDKDFKSIIDMMKSLREGTEIEDHINVSEVLKYFAANTFLVNLDSYSGGMYHNYYLYENNGVCEIIPWDLNMSFAGFSIKEGEKAINFPIDKPVTGNLEESPLIGKLLEKDEYKELYHSYLQDIVENYINSEIFNNTIVKLNKLIGSYIKEDPTAFYTYDNYKSAMSQLMIFGQDRAKSVSSQLDGQQPSEEYGTMSTALNLSALGGMDSKEGDKEQDNFQKNMGNSKEQGSEQERRKNNPSVGVKMHIPQGSPPQDMMEHGKMGNYDKNNNEYLGITLILTAMLLATLTFVANYKRKCYVKK